MRRPLYAKIEITTSPVHGWARIDAGWDWLGVDDHGDLILGYPGRGVWRRASEITQRVANAAVGEHGFRLDRPLASRSYWFPSERRAKMEFVRIVQEIRSGERHLRAALIQRIEYGAVVDEVQIGR